MFKRGWVAAFRCRLVPLALIRRGGPRPAPRSSGGPRPSFLVPAPIGRAARRRWRLRESGSRPTGVVSSRLTPPCSQRVARVPLPRPRAAACRARRGIVACLLLVPRIRHAPCPAASPLPASSRPSRPSLSLRPHARFSRRLPHQPRVFYFFNFFGTFFLLRNRIPKK